MSPGRADRRSCRRDRAMRQNLFVSFPRRNWKAADPDPGSSTKDTPAPPIPESQPRSGDHIPCRCIQKWAYVRDMLQGIGYREQGNRVHRRGPSKPSLTAVLHQRSCETHKIHSSLSTIRQLAPLLRHSRDDFWRHGRASWCRRDHRAEARERQRCRLREPR